MIARLIFPPAKARWQQLGLRPCRRWMSGSRACPPHLSRSNASAVSRWPSGPGARCWSEVLRVHARDGLVDTSSMYVDLAAYRPIGRLFGNLYTYQRESFAMDRESHSQWTARMLAGGAGEPQDT